MAAEALAQAVHPVRVPNLLYVGDVPVESTYHGSLLLYRLLKTYPADRLYVIEGSPSVSTPHRRLDAVSYGVLPAGVRRLMVTRISRYYSSWLTLQSRRRGARCATLLNGFAPEAVLTVAHGNAWLAAAAFAQSRRIPLHLIVHDDLPTVVNVVEPLKPWVQRQFAAVYRTAASRFCVSPYMESAYRERYGVEGNALLPSRSPECPRYDDAAAAAPRPITFAFAGTINSSGYAERLRQLAICLEGFAGRLLLFGPLAPGDAQRCGLDRPNIIHGGLIPPEELIARLRADADVLFVPMSFRNDERANMELSFPSKIVDYTATGVPILIQGPEFCSAVRWATSHPGVAAVTPSETTDDLRAVVEKFATDAPFRRSLAKAALDVGDRDFAHRTIYARFLAALQRH